MTIDLIFCKKCLTNNNRRLFEQQTTTEVNVRDCLQTMRKDGIYKSRVLHKAFNKGEIPQFVKSSKLPQIKNKAPQTRRSRRSFRFKGPEFALKGPPGRYEGALFLWEVAL